MLDILGVWLQKGEIVSRGVLATVGRQRGTHEGLRQCKLMCKKRLALSYVQAKKKKEKAHGKEVVGT